MTDLNALPPIDFAKLESMTPALIASGERLLQGHLLFEDKASHMTALLSHAGPPKDGVVVDVGCGVGELARHWHRRRPDLQFHLVNKVASQLDACPHGDAFTLHLADAHYMTSLPDNLADVVWFSYALCNMSAATALKEARRVAKPGGRVVLYEPMDLTGADQKTWSQFLWANIHRPDTLIAAGRYTGLLLNYFYRPEFVVDPFFGKLLEEGNLTYLLDGVGPAIMEFVK